MSLRPLLQPLTRSGFSAGSSRAATRTFLPAASRQHFFHTTRPQFVQPGDPLPDTDVLQENSPGNRVNLAEEARKGAKKMLLIGVPAAFSPACSSKHVPGYVAHPAVKKGEFDLVGVVSVNDVFV
jgi:2-Cys peroxiredoxin 5